MVHAEKEQIMLETRRERRQFIRILWCCHGIIALWAIWLMCVQHWAWCIVLIINGLDAWWCYATRKNMEVWIKLGR